MLDDLDDLRVVVAGGLDGIELGIGDLAAARHDGHRETHRGRGLGVVGAAAAVGLDLGGVELGEVAAQEAVGRQAVVAAVELGHGQRDALAGGGRQAALGQRAGHAEIALQRRRAAGDGAEQIGHAADLGLDGLQQGLGGGGGGIDGGEGMETGVHGGFLGGGVGRCKPVTALYELPIFGTRLQNRDSISQILETWTASMR